jgi:two-component system chemotaxis response regulator CheY
MRTLIVEDDFTSRFVLQSFLSEYGECHVAVNGREAVAAFRAAQESSEEYDLICMDIMMPEVDGHAAVREIRALEEVTGTFSTNRVKIIITTATGDMWSVPPLIRASSDAYLLKPIHKKELLECVRELHLI